MEIKEGATAPKFELESDAGKRVTLKAYAGKWLVVYFYPKDNTPGCTREAQAFSDAEGQLRKLGVEVVGISRDSVATHCGFRDKVGINFPLLSDPELVAHNAYGAWGTKTMYGKSVQGVIRSTFLVAPDGKISRVWRGVKVDGHVDKVIAAIEEASSGHKSAAKEKKKSKGA